MSNRIPLPSDQFERCSDELRKTALLIEEIQRAADVAEGMGRYEVQQRLYKAREHFELAGFYLSKAIEETTREHSRYSSPQASGQ